MPNKDEIAARVAELASSHGFLDVQAQVLTPHGNYRKAAVRSPSSSSPPPLAPVTQSKPGPVAIERVANLDGTQVYPKNAGPAGTGLFASRDFVRGELVFRVERPLGCVLDTPLLENLCEWCLRGKNVVRMGVYEETQVKKCGGCGVLRFCGEVSGSDVLSIWMGILLISIFSMFLISLSSWGLFFSTLVEVRNSNAHI